MSKEMEVAVVEGAKGTWAVFPGLCKGCGLCIEKCPVKCISWAEDLGVYGTPRVQADGAKCIRLWTLSVDLSGLRLAS